MIVPSITSDTREESSDHDTGSNRSIVSRFSDFIFEILHSDCNENGVFFLLELEKFSKKTMPRVGNVDKQKLHAQLQSFFEQDVIAKFVDQNGISLSQFYSEIHEELKDTLDQEEASAVYGMLQYFTDYTFWEEVNGANNEK